jgi:FkbM family methyltransferase
VGIPGRIRRTLNRPLHRVGVDLRRWVPGADFEAQRSLLLDQAAVDLVLDVGANEGQYATALRASGFSGAIISFEPLVSALSVLRAKASTDSDWQVIGSAAGAEAGRAGLNVAGNSVSSSLLPMLDRHVEAAPDSAVVGAETVEVASLDHLVGREVANCSAALLKIDVQGFEAEVIQGAREILEGGKVVAIEVELSFASLYEEQSDWTEVWNLIGDLGFLPRAIRNGFRDPASGELLQVDAIFGRADGDERVVEEGP